MAKLKTWIGASAGDAGIRLAAQLISTMVVARLLPPENFGLALLVLSVVGVPAAFIGLPFEESLTQRRRLQVGHLEVSLFVSLVLMAGALVLAVAVGPLLAHVSDEPGLAFWLPIATLFLVGQGPGAIARALARRYRRFVQLAVCQSLSVVIASVVSIILAFMGWGILALIVQRLLPNLIFPILIVIYMAWRGVRIHVRPRWHPERFRELFRFSWLFLADTGMDAATPAIFSFAANALFGTTVLGQINIAMRMVEPLRSAIESIGHNLAFSILARMQTDPRRAINAAADIVANVAALAVPAFLGLAVVAPILLPLLVGDGWDASVPIARLMCVAAAISVPLRYFYSGFSAIGRPEYGLAGSTLGLFGMLSILLVVAQINAPEAIGAVYVGNEAVTAALAILIGFGIGGGSIFAPLWQTLRIWIAGAGMVFVLRAAFFPGLTLPHAALQLVMVIVAGMVVYAGLLFIVCRPSFTALSRIFLRRAA